MTTVTREDLLISEPKLLDRWRGVMSLVRDEALLVPLAMGGKSMGGRMASLVADELEPDALVCLGFPFHAAGREIGERADHLRVIRTPTLIVQGERDPMGRRETVEGLHLSEAIRVQWMTDGDHGFRPRRASGHTEEENLEAAAEVVASYLTTRRSDSSSRLRPQR